MTVPALRDLGFQHFLAKDWRAFQAETVEQILRTDKKFVVCQAPTGFGKSPTAMALARLILKTAKPRLKVNRSGEVEEWPPQASILTATKQLQSQYVGDFGDAAREVKGRANFGCTIDPVPASEGLCTLSDVTDIGCKGSCPYYIQKGMAEKAAIVIHSYAYFLNAANYAGSFTQQELLVLDEGHLLDDMLMSFISSSARASTCAAFQINLPSPGKVWTWDQWKSWATGYSGDLNDQLAVMEDRIEADLDVRRKYKAGVALSRTMDFLREAEEKWVCVPSTDGWDFMPTWIGQYANKYLYRHAKKVVIMSATVLNPEVFCKVAGISPDEMEFIDIPSTFPAGSRPIYYDPAMAVKGGQGADHYRPLLDGVYDVMREHGGDKGLIHCVSYQIAQEVMNNAPADLRRRLMTHATADRLRQYDAFRLRKDDAILVSPSMKEGVSLEDDQCRFIVVCKVPYPYLGSPQIKARMDSQMGQAWFTWKAFCDLVQMTGRGMRSDTDSCAVYILDENFRRVFQQVKRHVPQYWKADLVDVRGAL